MCLFVRVLHFRGENVPQKVLDLLEQSPDKGRYFTAWREQFQSTPKLVFHETYHFWQGLRLPFLYWYALLSFRAIVQGFQSLNTIQNLHDWDCIIPALHRLNIQERCLRFADGRFGIIGSNVETPSDTIEEILLNPWDLLEAATSVAEWQMTISRNQILDPIAFRRWCKLNPSYTKAFQFATRALGDDELALRCFIPLVCAAFKTTDPVRAFLELLVTLEKNRKQSPGIQKFIAQREPCQWPNLFDLFLDNIAFEAKPDSTTQLLGSPYCRLNLSNWTNVTQNGNEVVHPFLTKLARQWLAKEVDNPAFSWLVPQPRWIDENAFWEAMNVFEPAYTFVIFHLDDEKTRGFSFGNEIDKLGYEVQDLMTMYSVMRRASGAFYERESRFCHHKDCPEYHPNYCNFYPHVPDVFTNCVFPKRVQRLRSTLRNPESGDIEK